MHVHCFGYPVCVSVLSSDARVLDLDLGLFSRGLPIVVCWNRKFIFPFQMCLKPAHCSNEFLANSQRVC